MDAAELEEIAFHREHGRPETTRGPYYHKTWWESYKGAVKGMLGGIVIGGMVGALAGGAVIGVLAASGVVALTETAVVGGILAATTLFGMYEGEKKFEKVGIATGAVAAAQEISEVRMKEYMRDKLTNLTNEIRELKAAVAGKISNEVMHVTAVREDTAPIFDESDFRATHTTSDDPSDDHKLIYWNVAAVGAAVGAATMAVATFGGGLSAIGALHHIGIELSAGVNAALVTAGAAFGGSFGISRDIFRKIFDVTDCWFMGVTDGSCSNEEIAKAKGKTFEPLPPHQPHSHREKQRLLINPPEALENQTSPSDEVQNPVIIGSPQSVYLQGTPSPEITNMALLGMDHTKAIEH